MSISTTGIVGLTARHQVQRHGRLRAEARRQRVLARQVLERPAHAILGRPCARGRLLISSSTAGSCIALSGFQASARMRVTPLVSCRACALDEAGTPGEIAEPFALRTLARVTARTAASSAATIVGSSTFSQIQHVQALTAPVAAEIQVVAAGRLADERDLGEIRPRAAVRAARDAQHERRIAQGRAARACVLDQLR